MNGLPIFVGPNGSDPVASIEALLGNAAPTVGDALFAGHLLRSRIYQRTASGVDAEGNQFASYSPKYEHRKLAFLGSASPVNLFGPANHPHMMNMMMVRCGGTLLSPDDSPPGDTEFPLKTHLFHLGFYGEEATRAQAHNEGTERLPRRHFFAATPEDVDLMGFAIRERIYSRMARK